MDTTSVRTKKKFLQEETTIRYIKFNISGQSPTRSQSIARLASSNAEYYPRRGNVVTSNLSPRDPRNIIIIHWVFGKCRFTPANAEQRKHLLK